MEWSPLPETASECQSGIAKAHQPGEATKMKVTAIGVDLAKNVIQLHGADASGKAVLKKQRKRNQVLSFFANLPPCVIGMEACAGAHHWARKLESFGHRAQDRAVDLQALPP